MLKEMQKQGKDRWKCLQITRKCFTTGILSQGTLLCRACPGGTPNVSMPCVKKNGRFVPKDWPPIDRRAKRSPQAGLPLFWLDRAKSPVFVVLFCSSGFTSQSTRNE